MSSFSDPLHPLLQNQDLTPRTAESVIPRGALALLKGIGIEKYSSRSEAEEACILSLINTGHDFPGVLSLFESYPCAGKYAELRKESSKNALRWLRLSYHKAYEYSQTHENPARQIARAAVAWAESIPWIGKTGAVDRIIFIAHCLIALKAGKLTYSASCRSLAELAGVSHETAAKSSMRLIQAGRLELSQICTVDCPNIYHLQIGTIPDTSLIPSVRKCQTLSLDVFRKGARRQGLGHSAREVYTELYDSGPTTVKELAERTGRSEKTIRRALKRMSWIAVDSQTGEVMRMVEQQGKDWRALEVDFEAMARMVGTHGVGERQKEKHERERRFHARQLSIMQKENANV